MSCSQDQEEQVKIIKFNQPQLSADDTRRERIENLRAQFRERTKGREAHYVICSPGRVNLIGDHIDYHGFPVLPMAIENATLIALSIDREETKEPKIKLFNVNPSEYPDQVLEHSFDYGPKLCQSHIWYNYILCAYHGLMAKRILNVQPEDIVEHARILSQDRRLMIESSSNLRDKVNRSIVMLIESDLPVASGLSSSSALVCGSAVATSLLILSLSADSSKESQPSINNRQIADECSKFEHLIGVNGGGMDQAVIMTAREGYAKYVEFQPTYKCSDVQLPRNTIWLVSHSGVKYPKAATFGFNTRVLETKLGAAMIAKFYGNTTIQLDKTITLAKVKEESFPNSTTADIVSATREKVFKGQNDFTVNEICSILGITRHQLMDKFNCSDDLLENKLNNKLRIFDRCQHVFEEAERVRKFKSICDSSKDPVELGRLMTESHQSLRDKYDCSHPALDKLVSVALQAGALGSRMTGAGWGGCVLTLAEADKIDEITRALKEVSNFTFMTGPKSGCHVIEF